MLGSEAREQNKVWLMQQVNHILEPLMLSMVRNQPEDQVSVYMLSDSCLHQGCIYGRIFGKRVR